jgi:hypothetical protein
MNASMDLNASRHFASGGSRLVSDPLFLSRNLNAAYHDIGRLNLTLDQWLPNLTDVMSLVTSNSNSSTDLSNTSGRLVGLQLDYRLLFVVTPFVLVFFAAVLGNLLVIATLVIDRRMRTVTNAFLLNLAIADLLLGIFCMPFTLLGFIMRQFMFGAFMCKLVSYLQGESGNHLQKCNRFNSNCRSNDSCFRLRQFVDTGDHVRRTILRNLSTLSLEK